MNEQWQELKETITEMRDNDGTGTQQEVCKFLVNLMDVLEKQMSNQNKGDLISRRAVLELVADYDLSMGQVVKGIHALPSVENKGEWIAQDIYNCHTNFKCSKCGYIHSFMHLYGKPTADYTYCPNCGADMRGE